MSAIDDLLSEARARLDRVPAAELADAMSAGALVVDIRPIDQRRRDGELAGAVLVDRNVLEWRLSPDSDARELDVDADTRVIVVCNQGYQSSLAAATLQQLGLPRATDLIGGYQALIGGPFDPNG